MNQVERDRKPVATLDRSNLVRNVRIPGHKRGRVETRFATVIGDADTTMRKMSLATRKLGRQDHHDSGKFAIYLCGTDIHVDERVPHM